MRIKIFVDDIRETPKGYLRCYTVKGAIQTIKLCFKWGIDIEELSLDHDAGKCGDDYIEIMKSLEFGEAIGAITCENIKFRFHSMNPVGVENMRRIAKRNEWKIIY